ncbi:hypothetical protein SLS64_010991 [Diaporthe eres]
MSSTPTPVQDRGHTRKSPDQQTLQSAPGISSSSSTRSIIMHSPDLATAKEPLNVAGTDAKSEEAGTVVPQGAAVEAGGVDERKLVRKLDLYLIWLVMSLYAFSFLDRVNIGNARLYHLEADLGLVGNQYQTAVSILFVPYLAFEVPSNLVLKKFTPRYWIAFITTAWGIIATLSGLVQSYGGLIACRVLLGAVEAGLFPGLAVYLTLFYTRHELALRVGYLFVSAAIAGALGGLLAYGIGHMDGVAGLHGWRWIMIIEGLPTLCLGVATFFLLPNDAQSAYFLNEAEKKAMVVRRAREYGMTASAQEFSKSDMMMAFKDWKVWVFCIAQFGADTMLYGYSTFLPTIINGLGKWTPAQLPNNCPRYGKRTTATGMQLTIGNASGVMAPFIYATAEGPRYIKGHAVTLSLVGMATVVYGLMSLYFRGQNKRREAGEVHTDHQHLSDDELAELGDESHHFRYVR